jgi:phosphoribosylformylglycinamidine cyclo-ligase
MYAQAGVNLKAGGAAKEGIKELAKRTHSSNVLKGIGLFSGFFSLDASRYAEPTLVSSIDGVGTKVKIVHMMEQYDTIGEDLVNHCVNDIMVSGADPLFFMDYIAADKLEVAVVTEIVRGIANGCQNAGCSLIGGETAEMPDVYASNNFDLAGCIVGAVDRKDIIDGSNAVEGDVVIGVASNGLHTNGYSLVRKVLFEMKDHDAGTRFSDLGGSLGEELLRIHRSYFNLIKQVRKLDGLHGIAHITGGGLMENTRRLLKPDLQLNVNWSAWEPPPIFDFIRAEGQISDTEMRAVFNMGVGLTLLVSSDQAHELLAICQSRGERSWVIGDVVKAGS